MDRYTARLLLTAVMFGAVAVSATLFSDALTQSAGSEPQSVTVLTEMSLRSTQEDGQMLPTFYLSVRTQMNSSNSYVTVLDSEGAAIGVWQTDADGSAVVGPLAAGDYYAKGSGTGYVRFTLHENAAVTVAMGCGWSDGELLHLTNCEPSRLEVICKQTQTAQSGVVTLTVKRADGVGYAQTDRWDNGTAVLLFDGLEQGIYDICLSDTVLETVAVDGNVTRTLTLP